MRLGPPYPQFLTKRTKRERQQAKRERKAAANRMAVLRADPASDAFLNSFEWRKARMQAIKTHGARCQCCGATTATGAVIHVDHIRPRKLFPSLALSQSNLQVLCHECNHGKGNWDHTDWR
jgi:5-methylcytosine-specific restriction endonuclease McrA